MKTAPRNLTALSADLARMPLAEVAAQTGESLGAVALRRCRDVLEGQQQVSSGVWRQLSPALREVLLTLCTDRKDTANDAFQGWATFTQDERNRIGAMARQFKREMQGAAWLR